MTRQQKEKLKRLQRRVAFASRKIKKGTIRQSSVGDFLWKTYVPADAVAEYLNALRRLQRFEKELRKEGAKK